MFILQIVSFGIGLTIVSYVVFSYEDEEKTLTNWFVKAWVSLDDKEKIVSERIASFLRALLSGLDRLLKRIYGEKVLSVRAFVTAISLCLGVSILALLLGMEYVDTTAPRLLTAFTLVLAPFVPWPKFSYSLTAEAVFAFAYAVSNVVAQFLSVELTIEGDEKYMLPMTMATTIMVFLALIVAATGDFFVLTATRAQIHAASHEESLRRIVVRVATATTPLPLFLLIVIFVGGLLDDEVPGLFEFISAIVYFALLPILTSVSFAVVLAVATVGRVLYALLPRTVYLAIKIKLMESRKSTAGIGVLLMSAAWPKLGALLERVTRTLFP